VHPVYEAFATALTSASNSDSLISSFWGTLLPHFTGPHNRYQQMAAMKLCTFIVKKSSLDSIHSILSNWFMDMLLKSFTRPNADTLVFHSRLSISAVMDRLSSSATPNIAYKVLLKFILPPGDMMVEKITGNLFLSFLIIGLLSIYITMIS